MKFKIYDPYKNPPEIELAKNHLKANSVNGGP